MDAITQEIAALAAGCGGTVSVSVRGIENAADLAIGTDEVMSAASVIKVPMLVEAMRQVRDGVLSLDEDYALAEDDRTGGSGVIRYLHQGLTLTIDDLLTLMIVVSDNAATNILIDRLGMENVNSAMRDMGLTNTLLRRRMMDWKAIERGEDNITTAAEMADLLVRIATGSALGERWDQLMLQTLRRQQDVGKLGLFLPDGSHLANKTGGREGILHDCGIVEGPGLRYAIAVFTRDAKSSGEAIVAVAKISRAVYDWIAALRI